MENNDRRQRQSNPSGYAGQQGLLPNQSPYPVVSASDRFRQTSLAAQAPTSAPSSGSRANPQSYGYAYGEGSQFVGSSLQQSNVAYAGQEYAQEQQQQRASQQQYPNYGQNVMYNVSGQQAAAAPQSPYESVPPYQPRQSTNTALEVLSNQFGVAQQYYVPGESGPTSAPAAALGTQNVPSQYQSLGYTTQQSPVGRETLAPAYTTAPMTDPTQATSQGSYSQPAYSAEPAADQYETFYNNYQAELKKTFEFTRDGRLTEAAGQLYRLSDWLLHWAETLGLVRDEETQYQQRLKLWEEFNNCWLTTLQKQKDMLQELVDTSREPQAPQNLIQPDFLEKMGNQLVKNCDNMEKHGLVDYQMGVWEEEIVAMLSTCLDLWEETGVTPSGAQRATSSSITRRR